MNDWFVSKNNNYYYLTTIDKRHVGKTICPAEKHKKKEINSITINYTYRYMIMWLNIKISHVHNGVKNNHKNSLQ